MKPALWLIAVALLLIAGPAGWVVLGGAALYWAFALGAASRRLSPEPGPSVRPLQPLREGPRRVAPQAPARSRSEDSDAEVRALVEALERSSR